MTNGIETIARAFYDASDLGGSWETASEDVRSMLRDDAMTALKILAEHYGVSNEARVLASPNNAPDENLRLQ
jgi:imidazolonepropionase-like amidohydrolase